MSWWIDSESEAEMAINLKEQSAIQMFRRQLTDQLGNMIEKVVLFGSKARGDDHPRSDVDLLVICNSNDWRIADKVYLIATDVMLETGIAISPKVLARQDYRRMQQNKVPFLNNVIRDGVAV